MRAGLLLLLPLSFVVPVLDQLIEQRILGDSGDLNSIYLLDEINGLMYRFSFITSILPKRPSWTFILYTYN